MRVLLLGADGFIGSRVADLLLADPSVELVVLGRRDSSDIRFDLATGSPGALVPFLDAVAPRAVVNCVGATRGPARTMVRANTVAVATLCEAMRRSRHAARLVHLGSAAEYGSAQVGVAISEDAEPQPTGAFATAKLAGTELVLGSGLDAVVLRLFTVTGPGTPRHSPLGRIAEGLRSAMQSGERHLDVPDLSGFRDFVDVRDVARAVRAAMVSAAGGVVNIGSGSPTRMRAAAGLLARSAGWTGRFREEGGLRPPVPPVRHPGHAPAAGHHHGPGHHEDLVWQQADIRTARERLGWRPRIPLDESVADVWMEAACRI
ncbi:reductase [Mangrovactinospora gilvigrisea]|uniref:Reductase n=1 Tax=Mangrovactinospora gilvigrisea TaxID=1428644 RepID=A0A1J7BTZ8_9ACTN|nr:NAD(P)-dependent oxidoreductase [Mangrovactinospora gilvigrisea]OIV36921.1 reductase [Mangrovactinospora gilvigrisea]